MCPDNLKRNDFVSVLEALTGEASFEQISSIKCDMLWEEQGTKR